MTRLRGVAAATSVLAFAGLAGAAGCSDPVPPTPQGAFQATFVSDSSACGIAGHNAQIGSVSATTKDQVVVSGSDPQMLGATADVECSVVGTSTFDVDAKISYAGQGLQISVKKLTSKASKDSPVDGSVSFASVKTSGTAFTSPTSAPCKFYFSSTDQGVASGRVWLTFDCPTIVQGTMKTCKLGPGFAIFENCSEVASQ